MSFSCKFTIGETVTNHELYTEFKCANMGGMRRSKSTNTLVIISDHTKELYDDKWFGDILHYTGMGKIGDQDFDRSQNKTLANSHKNGVDLHLFEVFKPGKYIYQGIVELVSDPYEEMQKDDEGNPRIVLMFPVRKTSEK